MGTFSHHTIVVLASDNDIKKIHEKAKELFEHLVSEIVDSRCNFYSSFYVAPDGSKEGWDTSNKYDFLRKEFIIYLSCQNCYFVEVEFGSEIKNSTILNSSDLKLGERSYFGL